MKIRPFISSMALAPLLGQSATAADATAAPADASTKAQAMNLFERGSRAYAGKRYKDAIDLFLEGDAVIPTLLSRLCHLGL